MAWLTVEVMAFYLNIIAMATFLAFSTIFIKYKSVKDRCGMSPTTRKQTDLLTYCMEDLHWFCCWFTQAALCGLALLQKTEDYESIQWCCGILLTRHVLEAIVLARFYFGGEDQ